MKFYYLPGSLKALQLLMTFLLLISFANQNAFGNHAEPLKLLITGERVPKSYLISEAEKLLASKGLVADFNLIKSKLPVELFPGNAIKLLVPVLENNKKTFVPMSIENHLLPSFSQTFLMFSDHPETIRKSGLLFQGGLISFRTVRFNYYHVNSLGEPERELLLVVKNNSSNKALLHTMGTTGGPSPWEMEIGHRVNVQFLKHKENRLGRIYEVPPKSEVVIVSQKMLPGQLVSGLYELQLLTGKPLEFSLYAKTHEEELKEELLSDEKDVHARGIYELPELAIYLRVNAGEEKSLLLGDLPVKNLFPGRSLKGSYGVIWHVFATLVNDTNFTRHMGIYFQPRGGIATGTFQIKNSFREVSPTPPYNKVLLAEVLLPPKTKHTIPILTLPEGASNYPVKLIFSDRDGGASMKFDIKTLEHDGNQYLSLEDLLDTEVIKGVLDLKEKNIVLENQPVKTNSTPNLEKGKSSYNEKGKSSYNEKGKIIYGQVLIKQDQNLFKPAPYLKIKLFVENSSISYQAKEELILQWFQYNDLTFLDNNGLVQETTTNANGYYFFENIPKGKYELFAILGKIGQKQLRYWLIPIDIGSESVKLDLSMSNLTLILLDINRN